MAGRTSGIPWAAWLSSYSVVSIGKGLLLIVHCKWRENIVWLLSSWNLVISQTKTRKVGLQAQLLANNDFECM